MERFIPSMMCESTSELWNTNILNIAHTYVPVLYILPLRDISTEDADF